MSRIQGRDPTTPISGSLPGSKTPGIAGRKPRARWARRSAVVLATLIAGCAGDDPVAAAPEAETGILVLELVASGLASPVYLTAPSGDDKLYIVEQPGRIVVLENGQIRPLPFLDIRARVRSGGERGLLGMAFPPDYQTTGHVAVHYIDLEGDGRVARFTLGSGGEALDPTSEEEILAVGQPFANHNGGQIEFGPDGMLYVALGDGGSGGDPLGSGQNRQSLLGSILRLDLGQGLPYRIPNDNPFAGAAEARPEIWALGLRNPWRFSFDRESMTIYVADVGQDRWEEVNAAPSMAAGINYGWNVREGAECFGGGSCDSAELTDPVLAYSHEQGCSITGGYVYRGTRVPTLIGRYVYSDFCAGWIRSFRLAGGLATDQRQHALAPVPEVTSFGQDGSGELYVLSRRGDVYRLAPQQ